MTSGPLSVLTVTTSVIIHASHCPSDGLFCREKMPLKMAECMITILK